MKFLVVLLVNKLHHQEQDLKLTAIFHSGRILTVWTKSRIMGILQGSCKDVWIVPSFCGSLGRMSSKKCASFYIFVRHIRTCVRWWTLGDCGEWQYIRASTIGTPVTHLASASKTEFLTLLLFLLLLLWLVMSSEKLTLQSAVMRKFVFYYML